MSRPPSGYNYLNSHHHPTSCTSTTRSGGCSFSSSSSDISNQTHIDNKLYEEDDKDPRDEEIVLYQRLTNPSVRVLQSGLAFSMFHTLYWVWYTRDFIPIVNASDMPELHIDPGIGYAGIAFGLALNFVFALYPKRLISKLTYRHSESKIMVYTHRLPIIRPSEMPNASFPIGPQSVTSNNNKNSNPYFKLPAASPHAQRIVNELRGDLTQYNGQFPVGNTWPRYSLDIQSSKDVPEPEYLLEALLRPESFQGELLVEDIRREQQNYSDSTTRTSEASSARPWNAKFPKPRRKYGGWTNSSSSTTTTSFHRYKKSLKAGKRKR
jgi:hypothetical protein